MSKLSFRARALDASKPMPIYLAEELPDLPDYSAINRAVPQMPSGMEKEEESEHHLQRAISGTGLIIPTPEVCQVSDLEFYERCYPPDYKMPKQHIHMQPLWEEQEAPEYDIDTEDERWLKQQRHPELTELKFEQMMDKLEKSSGQTVVTLNEAKLLLERNDDLVIAVYDYWLNKRLNTGRRLHGKTVVTLNEAKLLLERNDDLVIAVYDYWLNKRLNTGRRLHGKTVVTLNEAKLLLERNDDLVIAVYDYWLNKRLNTQHPLILSVKTENRPGQSSNNPYLAFRRRTEKMQTRKNRKNDESSYEKMLKLRRDLARALTLLELVARRESAKRELVRLTALIAERRYAAGDFANTLLPEPPPRPAYTAVPLTSSSFRREAYVPHYPPRPPPTPVDQPRQREKRPYKRRKHRHPVVGSVQGLRDSGVYTSSEEEGSSRAEAATPPDDGPFAFRRKPGCYYEMPTSTLYGDPLDPDDPSKEGLFQHEVDERYRYTLTSLGSCGGSGRCVGFARRRVCRGGRVALDRRRTPLDDLFTSLPFSFPNSSEFKSQKDEEVELETKAHRTPKEMSRDYHTSGKYPWRHAFRKHLSKNPDLWTSAEDAKPDIKQETDLSDADTPDKADRADLPDLPDVIQDSVKSDIRFSARTIDGAVRDNLERVMRKRAWSGCSESSYDSDESLQPVEKEFEQFINEVNKKWLHFRPKTPPLSPPVVENHSSSFPVALDTPLSVELRAAEAPPPGAPDCFTTSEFTLGDLYPDLNVDVDNSATSLDISGDDLLTENFTGLTEDQVESILSETDVKALAEEADKKIAMSDDMLDELVADVDAKEPFLLHGQSSDGRADSGPRKRKADAFGSTVVNVTNADKEPIYIEMVKIEPPPPVIKIETPKPKEEKPADITTPVPSTNIIVEEVNEVPMVKIEKKRKEDTIEEVTLPHGVQLKTVQTRHSPLKKHIITSAAHRRAGDAPDAPHTSQPQIVTVAVSDSLKVRLQNHLLSTQSGVLVQNGPFPPVVAVPMQQARDGTGTATVAGAHSRRLSAPLVSLAHKHVLHAPAPLVVQQQHLQHVPPAKLKVLHAHPLTQSQRTALLAQNRALQGLPAVVSLAALDNKPALLKAAPQAVAQLFEIKGGALGKGPHLVNVLRQPAPRQDAARRVALSLDGRQLVRAALPVRHPLTLKPRALVANLLHGAHKPGVAAVPAVLKRRAPAPPAPAPPPAASTDADEVRHMQVT
ncbi:hypothetical protein PYW07_011801 [Mythimna separata]|uniref:Enhancer of polycomb-like protein n=1 Tax=Mythimna separata TaxID=271217 RepID=A0AAD7Y704_MYTSE|nr:hypothetical protein PYW07_011801 [Mythimna separata]